MVRFPWIRMSVDVDWVDAANGFWSVLLLAVCSVWAFYIRTTSAIITCWAPAHFTGIHIKYAMDTCSLTERFYVLHNETYQLQPPNGRTGNDYVTSYHLWIPLILFLQALCFMIPSVIWRLGKRCLAFNVDETVSSLDGIFTASPETQRSTFGGAAQILGNLLQKNNFLYGLVYLLVKLLYLINLVGQFVFLTICFRQMIAIKAGAYVGFDLTSRMEPLMHKSVICDFDIIMMQNRQRYAVQCTLPIVDIYEKMFVFLWYWVFFLTIVTIVSLLSWAGFLFLPFLRDGRISAYIKGSSSTPTDPNVISRFVSSTLGIDGVLMMTMISNNSSELVAAGLTQAIYAEVFQKNERPGPYLSQPGPGAAGYAHGGDPARVSVPGMPAEDMQMVAMNQNKPLLS